MLSHEDNELMCRVEPGYPMHEAFKRYWLVAGLSDDHPTSDSDPKRTTLLGEDYVLFRDSKGQMACLRELCCHRGASLCLGRVEEGGIRCIYHGWKFDAEGKVLDMPNASDERFKERYAQPAFPVREIGGLIWVYLGPPEEQPPAPNYYWLHLPADRYWLAPAVFDANYTQVIDGGADSSHLTILHQDAFKRAAASETLPGGRDNIGAGRVLGDSKPRFDTLPTEFGQFSVAIRKSAGPDGDVRHMGRVSAFIAPATVLVTGGHPDRASCAIAVPVTSYRTILYVFNFNRNFPLDTEEKRNAARAFQGLDQANMDALGMSRETCDQPHRFSRADNWRQDRAAMRSGQSFTGLSLFVPEDVVVAESMGAIYDRTQENLVPADTIVVRIRRILLDMARDVQAGRKPIGVRGGLDDSQIYVTEGEVTADRHWTNLLPEVFQPAATGKSPLGAEALESL